MDFFMPKKIKKCFDANLSFEKLLQAHYRAKKHKSYRNEVVLFELNLENNLINLTNAIKNNKYRQGRYQTFIIREPKERIIQYLPYIDRVVHQWYVEEFLKPYITAKFISTSFACLNGKGTHKSADKIQEFMRIFKKKNPNFWILKCDIKKYFI